MAALALAGGGAAGIRNGTLVFSGGNGVGVVTAIYTCNGSATSDFRAVWSTGQSDEASFARG